MRTKFTQMIGILSILIFPLLISTTTNAQGCQNASQYPTNPVVINNDVPPQTISTCNWEEEYALLTGAIVGNSYTISSSGLTTYITVRQGAVDGPILSAGVTPVNVVIANAGDLYVHFNVNEACDTDDTCIITTILCTNCDPLPPPANDDVCNATALSCGDELVGLTFLGATQSIDDDCGGSGTADVWFSFQSNGTQAVTVSETSSSDAVVGLYQGNNCGELVPILDCRDFPENFTVTEAGNYYFRVRPYSNATTLSVSLTCADFATNDEACTATQLTCGQELTNLAFAGATQSIDDACGGSGTADVWFSFQANGSQAFTVAETSSPGDMVVGLYQGNSCGDLVPVIDCQDFPENFTVTEAGTYYFRVRPYSTAASLSVSLTCADFATNDEACTATQLTCGQELSNLTFAGASQSIDDACGGAGTADVWFSFQSDGTQTVNVAETSSGDMVVGLYQGNNCGALTEITECQDGPENFTVSEAGSYYFRVRPYSTATTLAVSLSCVTPPVNDDICEATPINCGDALDGTTLGATYDDAGTCTTTNTAPGVWYVFTPTTTGVATFSLCTSFDYDTKLSAYAAASCTDETLTCMAGNDDTCDLGSEIEFDAVAGTTYYILVHGFNQASGNFTLTATCVEGIPGCTDPNAFNYNPDATVDDGSCENNDACTLATPVLCGQEINGSTTGNPSPVDGLTFCGTSASSAPSVWHTYTALATEVVTVDLTGSSYDTKVFIYSGSCNEPVCITGDDDGGEGTTSLVTFDAVMGQTYYILVAGYLQSAGDYVLNITAPSCDVAGSSLNGSVTWNAACGDRGTTVLFYLPGTTNLVATYNTMVGADGNFSIQDVQEGIYDVFVKVDGYLQKGFANVAITPGTNNLAVGTITPGDVNNVDGVNIDDLTILLSAFGSTTGDPNFNPLADLNCDGDVNIDDLTLLLPNFGQSGDNPPLN